MNGGDHVGHRLPRARRFSLCLDGGLCPPVRPDLGASPCRRLYWSDRRGRPRGASIEPLTPWRLDSRKPDNVTKP